MGLVAGLATAFSLLYLIFAIRNKAICFVFGIVSSAFWAYESFFNLNLVFDAGLQLFYIAVSAVGIYRWRYGGIDNSKKPITKLGQSEHVKIILFGIVGSVILVLLSQWIDNASFRVLDTFTTVFMILGSILLVERKLYSWIYLVVCDIAYIYIYSSLESWLFTGMMVVYTFFGLMGYYNWISILNKESINYDTSISEHLVQ